MRRLVALLLVALGLTPGTWWRSPVPAADNRQIVSFTPLPQPDLDLGPLRLAGAWQMRSANEHFGSYSALAVLSDWTLLAASDRGRMLLFPAPGEGRSAIRRRAGSGSRSRSATGSSATTRVFALGRSSGRKRCATGGRGSAPVSYTHLTLPTTERV